MEPTHPNLLAALTCRQSSVFSLQPVFTTGRANERLRCAHLPPVFSLQSSVFSRVYHGQSEWAAPPSGSQNKKSLLITPHSRPTSPTSPTPHPAILYGVRMGTDGYGWVRMKKSLLTTPHPRGA